MLQTQVLGNIDITFRVCYIANRVEATICRSGLVARPRWEGGLQGASCETGHLPVFVFKGRKLASRFKFQVS